MKVIGRGRQLHDKVYDKYDIISRSDATRYFTRHTAQHTPLLRIHGRAWTAEKEHLGTLRACYGYIQGKLPSLAVLLPLALETWKLRTVKI